MNTQPVIMIQIADPEWTRATLHRACMLSRQHNATITLVQMIPVGHPAMMGTAFGILNFTDSQKIDFADYQATIEDYGIACKPVLFQYSTLVGAIVEAAQNTEAMWVFAQLPHSILPFWDRIQHRLLHRALADLNATWVESAEAVEDILSLQLPSLVSA